MKHLHFDSVGGASGDLILATLLDLGVNRADLQQQLENLKIGPFEIEASPARDRGLHGTRVRVKVAAEIIEHEGRVTQEMPDEHRASRALKEIQTLVLGSPLATPVKAASLAVFQRLAEAEAKVHGIPPDKVHFHEVGAVDAIIDIVGACLALEQLEVASVSVGPLPLGHGTIECAHGVLPVPAPATIELLKGLVVMPVDESFELVTPTGAALLATWKTQATFPAGGRILKVGYGIGHWTLNTRPNVLRATLMEADAASPAADSCLVLECNLDDLAPELVGALLNRLLRDGALDVFVTPVQMKKERPGILLTVLCQPEKRLGLLDAIFRESTTFGVREHAVQRTVLERRHENVKTPFGEVRVKIGRWRGADVTVAPEYEDCRRAAEKAGVSVRAVYEAAVRSSPAL
ncbi:MAG: nickel pincer cofactor biosynthesis protein LarC [Lentisphaerae bacterium]|nr:nickel pincer cofactor biosynthesis protein LarC [Lentisphaerota bacterium]